jgi:hypothetical protein
MEITGALKAVMETKLPTQQASEIGMEDAITKGNATPIGRSGFPSTPAT